MTEYHGLTRAVGGGYFSPMRKISLWLLVLTLAISGARAQDAATQQQIDKLSGQLQDIIDAEAAQSKRLDAMEHEISDLRDKVNTPAVNDSASTGDLKKLAEKVREIDQKQQDDKELILGKIEELAKISAAPLHSHKPAATPKETPEEVNPAAGQTHLEYTVQPGNTLSAIVKAYRDKGIKVTVPEVLKANPGLTATTLYIGKTIIIPLPDAAK